MRNLEKILTGTALAIVLAIGVPQMGIAGFDEAVKAYEAGDYKLAFEEWLPLAENNDPAAMRNLGHLYRRGFGVDLDFEKAMSWYRQAANMGFDRAQANVGNMYLKGQGVRQDYVKASEWFTKAARNGHTISQYNLGLLYEHGKGVEKSSSKALGWYNLAAKAGHPQALNKLSILIATDPTVIEEKAETNKRAETTKPQTAPLPEKKEEVVIKQSVQPSTVAEKKTRVAEKEKQVVVQSTVENAPAKKKWDPFAGSANNLTAANRAAPTGEPTVFNQKTTQKVTPKPVSGGEQATSARSAVTNTVQKTSLEPTSKAVVSEKSVEPLKKSEEEKGFFSALKSLLTVSPEEETKKIAVPKEPQVKETAVSNDSVAVMATTVAVAPPPSPEAPINITGAGLTLDEQMEMAELSFTLEEYQQALGIWAPLAQRGNAEAQYNLGVMFEGGYAVPVDRVRAFYWWQKAKRNGSQKAASSLVNLEKSLTYLEKRQLQHSN